jgi:hypothetical protein
MAIEHDEHWYLCDECEGTGMAHVPVNDDQTVTELSWCADCGDGMSKGLGYIEGGEDDCETNPCDVATGSMTL